jgi:hypothetical protein
MVLTLSDPKKTGKSAHRVELKIHWAAKCMVVIKRGQGKAKCSLPKTNFVVVVKT